MDIRISKLVSIFILFLTPLGTQPICLTCHGSGEQIPPAVQAMLARYYPLDQAQGYQAGDLRGAVSIKQPMDIPLRNTADGK
jgi:hypothetical protein